MSVLPGADYDLYSVSTAKAPPGESNCLQKVPPHYDYPSFSLTQAKGRHDAACPPEPLGMIMVSQTLEGFCRVESPILSKQNQTPGVSFCHPRTARVSYTQSSVQMSSRTSQVRLVLLCIRQIVIPALGRHDFDRV